MKNKFKNHIVQNLVAILLLALSNVILYQFGNLISFESSSYFAKNNSMMTLETKIIYEIDELLQDFSMSNHDIFVTKNPQIELNHLNININKLNALKNKVNQKQNSSVLFNDVWSKFEIIVKNNQLMIQNYQIHQYEKATEIMSQNDAKISELNAICGKRLRQINSDFEKISEGHFSTIQMKRVVQFSFFIWSFFSIVIIVWVMFGLIHSIRSVLYENNVFMHSFDRVAIFSMTDLEGNIVYVNDFFCQVSGFTREELIGKNHRILNSGTHSTIFFQNIWALISKGNTWRGRICNRRKDGSLYWVDAQINPTYDEKGIHNGYSSTRILIDDLVDLEQNMSLYQRELAQQSKYKLSNIALKFFNHDFNNSLQAIELFAHNMVNEVDASNRKITSNKIVELGHHASDYLARISKFSRDDEYIAEGQLYLKDLIQDITFFIGQRLHRYEIDLLLTGEYHNFYFYCHPVQILQAFLHLMFDLFEKSILETGPRYIAIEVSELSEGKLVIVLKNNSGVGTFQENQSNLLSHYNNARQIFEGHQSMLTVESENDKTYFKVEISLVKKPV